MAVQCQIDAWDPVAGAAVTLRAGSLDTPSVCHSDSNTWWPVLAKLPTLRYDLFDGSFESQISAPSSTLTLRTEPWPNFGRYSLPDARLQLWTGGPDDPGGVWTLRFDGRATAQPKVSDGAAEIDFAVDDKWLDTALLTTYAGTTGAEGPVDLKGQVKPLAIGAPRYVPGKLIDSVNSVFQVSSYGGVQEFEVAFDKLIRFPAPLADYPTYAALVAAAIPAGQWATAKAVGMARFGAPPVGLVSFNIKGDVGGPDGWARKPGELIRRLALLSGGAGKIDDASLDALDAARPYDLSIYLEQQTTARQLIQDIAASVNAVAGMSWIGKLFVVPIDPPAPGAATKLAADGSSLPATSAVEQIGMSAPWRKLAIGAQRAWAVHALNDIAFTAPLVPLGLYDPTTTYREGNIVSTGDGSTFLYISTTPTAGNAPPAPTSPPAAPASNTWWFQQSPPLVSLTARLSNESHVVTADSLGVVASYSGAGGTMQIFDGAANVTASFTLSTASGGNPQGLAVSYAGAAYSVTGGLDAGEPSATLTIRASGSGTYAGISVDRVFSIAKAIAGDEGNYRDVKYQRSMSQPATPTGDDPAGWSDGIPSGAATLWASVALKTFAGVVIGVWSTPQSLSGLTPRGTYDAGTTYYLNNVVSYAGGSYIAVQNNFSSHAPSGTGQANAFWDVYAAPGEPGQPATPPSGFSATINLTSGAAVNLRSVADANGYTGLSDATITFNVPNGVTIRGLSHSGIGIDSGTWPTTSYTITLALVVQSGGIVDGGGGDGGSASGADGIAGGDAIYCRTPMSVTINAGGTVRAGGGGGGGGLTTGIGSKIGGGGGGGGAPNGSAGTGDEGYASTGADGSDGTTSGGGSAGSPGGGAGGGFATAGSNSSNGGGHGGAAGYAVRKNGLAVTVSNSGTMTGTAA